MGFNNGGVEAVERLKENTGVLIEGILEKITPNEDATLDYEICFDVLFDYVLW
jgi:dihydroorotate dehydrogenase